MPPKQKITKEMIIQAAVELVRAQGPEALNVRAIAGELQCSTQPVMYHFASMEAVRQAVYARADEMHTAWIMQEVPGEHPLLAMGLNYIRFAVEEKHLFRLLFQSNGLGVASMGELFTAEGAAPLIAAVEASGVQQQDALRMFTGLFLTAHGLASLLANNAMAYDEAFCRQALVDAYSEKGGNDP